MARTDKWQVKETIGNQYMYVSKNGNDVAASNYFGKAAAWVSGSTYAIGDRVTSSSIQYYNKTGVNTSTAPASDSTNWGFDKSNFQTYATGQTYAIGDKTNYSNEHYVCTVNGSTGTFQPGNWTKVVVSNKDYPYYLISTAVTLANADARFVSYEVLDYPNNKAYYKIHILISNGVWSETLTAPTKYMRFVGQSKWKTQISTSFLNVYMFVDTILLRGQTITGSNYFIKLNNCTIDCIIQTGNVNTMAFTFCYKNIFIQYVYSAEVLITHFVNNIVLTNSCFSGISNAANDYNSNTRIKNNYFAGTVYFHPTTNITAGNFNYNRFVGTVYINNVAKTTIGDLQTATPNQNTNSAFIAAQTFNNDYTLPSGSLLLGTGEGGINIGAENRGYSFTTSTILDSANGATYKNIAKVGTILQREQVNKYPQAATAGNITLDSSASAVDETYTGFRIKIVDGAGINQTKTITAYNGTTKVATIDTNWSITPDQYSVYEILDGEVISAIGDIGAVKVVKNLNILTTNLYDVFGKYQTLVSSSNVDDGPDSLDFYLKAGVVSNLAGSSYRLFKQDDYLRVDSSGRASGDSSFDADNVSTDNAVMRYFQIKVQLHKN